MIEICDTCNSIIRNGHCSNERCGTGNIPRGWKPRKPNERGEKLEDKTCTLKQVTDKDADGYSTWFCCYCSDSWEWEDASLVRYCPSCGAKILARWAKEGE